MDPPSPLRYCTGGQGREAGQLPFSIYLQKFLIENRMDATLIHTYKMPDFHPVESVSDKEGCDSQTVTIMLGKLPYSGCH
jgi:hypothetical protein